MRRDTACRDPQNLPELPTLWSHDFALHLVCVIVQTYNLVTIGFDIRVIWLKPWDHDEGTVTTHGE